MPRSRIAPVDLLDVSYRHPGASGAAVDGLSLCLGPGWTGITGPNGSGKTTLLRLLAGEIDPDTGTIGRAGLVVRCPQDTAEPPDGLDALLAATSGRPARLRARLAMAWDWLDRWSTLSHGERKRAQVGVALAAAPDVLLLDEPTNHLDAGGRDLLVDALRAFAGIGVVISHDRALLDALCSAMIFMHAGGAETIPGSYTTASEERERRHATARRERAVAKGAVRRLETERASRAADAAQADRKRSKRGIPKRDHDARDRIARARVSGKDGLAGRRLSQMAGRLAQARERAASIGMTKLRDARVVLPGTRSRRAAVIDVESGVIPMGAEVVLRHPRLRVGPGERVALTGPNGAGKSTLVKAVLHRAALREPALVVPQEIPLPAAVDLLERLADLAPGDLGRVLTVVASLGSDPAPILESGSPSPGELRKLMLGLGTLDAPELIVMDEPTNHLDLPSVEALETTLRDCPAALVLVSHDERFLRAAGCTTTWSIDCSEVGDAGARLTILDRRHDA